MGRTLVSVVSALALTACAGQTGQYAGPDAGYAMASLAADTGTEYSSHRFLFRSRDGTREGEFVWLQNNWFSSDKPDFTQPGKAGELTVVKLAPGEYELYSYSVFQNGYPATMTYGPRESFAIPFTVKTGQATYLGEYMAVATFGKNIFGGTVNGGPIYVVSDELTRDTAIAKAEMPAIARVESAVPKPATLRPPLFASKPKL